MNDQRRRETSVAKGSLASYFENVMLAMGLEQWQYFHRWACWMRAFKLIETA